MNMKSFPSIVIVLILIMSIFSPIASAYAVQINFVAPTADNASVVSENHTLINVTVDSSLGPDNTTAFVDWNSSLLGWWRFDGENGTFVEDHSTYQRNGTMYNMNSGLDNGNSGWTTEGKFGNAIMFDGLSARVEVPDNSAYDIPIQSDGKITMEAWVYPVNLTYESGILSKRSNYRMIIRSGGELKFQSFGWTSGGISSKVKVNEWSHIAITYDGETDQLKFYLNGNNVKTVNSYLPNGGTNSNNLLIGRGHDLTMPTFNGTIDEVRLWKRILNPEEIKASYNAGQYRLETDITDIEDGTYTYIAHAQDIGGNVNHTETRTITIDTTSPVSPFILFDTASDDTKSNETINISGTVNALIESNITIDHNGNMSSVPVENGSFTATLDLDEVNIITASGTEINGRVHSATLLLDGDILLADAEIAMGFDPLDPDSDSTLTPENESGNGIPDGLETLNGGQLPSFAKYRIGADPLKEDTDDDNLTDYFELMQLGLITDIGSDDTDGDGIPDADEDLDEDGLTNIEEQALGTDPLKPDTDGDTLDDGFEVNSFSSNPLLIDSDEDGLEDDSEFRLGTNPNNPDTYGSGTPDGLRTFTSNASDSTSGTSLFINGVGDLAQNVSITQENSSYYTNISSMVSPLVDISLNESFNYVDISMEYDPTKVTNASNLSLCYFNETYGLYVPVSSTIDAVNNSVSANVSHLSTWAVFDAPALMDLYKRVNEFNHEAHYSTLPSIPTPGDKLIVPYNSTVFLKFLSSSAYYNNEFGLWSPTRISLGYGHSTATGTEFNLGNFTRGTELIFYITNPYGNRFFTGPASRNPDGVTHAYIVPASNDTWTVYWEDMYNGGDKSYRDVIYNVTFVNSMADSDEDGIPGYVETHGIMDNLGHVYYTDPENPDTDGDGLTDGEETGVLKTEANSYITYSYSIISDPISIDSDNDGIDDPDEAEFSTGMMDWDSDNDNLADGFELGIGTEPLIKDTDFDGYSDYEEYLDSDHDPLVYEKRYSHYEVTKEIVLGAVLGEFGYEEHDSVYYLTGHLISGLVVVGDVRDFLASVSHGDEIGAVLNLAGLVPVYGDAGKVVSKFAEFGAKHADEAGIVVIKIIDYVPSLSLKADVLKAMSSSDYYGLVAKGFDDNSIIKLSEQGIDFVKFNRALDATNAFADYPGLNTFLKSQIDNTGAIMKDRCTFNAKKASAAQKAGKSTYVNGYINNLKGAYTEDLLAKYIGENPNALVKLSKVNKGGIDYADISGTTLKIGEAKAVQSLSLSKLKNYIKPNTATGDLEFNLNYAQKEIGDAYLKNPSIQKEFVLYVNSPTSGTIKQALNLPESVPYNYLDDNGQKIIENVKITVISVSE